MNGRIAVNRSPETDFSNCLRIAIKSDWYPTHIARIQFYLSCLLREKNMIAQADKLEAASFEFRDKIIQSYSHLLKNNPANKGAVFDQILPFMSSRLTGKLVSRYDDPETLLVPVSNLLNAKAA